MTAMNLDKNARDSERACFLLALCGKNKGSSADRNFVTFPSNALILLDMHF